MTFFKPTLLISRLYVQGDGKVYYDEKFHHGVNIIRSCDNSVGKSSIMDLIFYSLGGDVTNWIPELGGAENILLEVEINKAPWTLRREFPRGDAPMYIYEGTIKESQKNQKKWFKYPYKRSKHQSSFSQEIFKILGFPEQKTDLDDNITMNQVLRLMYEDQITPVDKLFKDIEFDKEATRRAIYELVMGIDDLELHWERMNLKKLEKELSEFRSEYKALAGLMGNSSQSPEQIIQSIEDRKEELTIQLESLNKSINTRLDLDDGDGIDVDVPSLNRENLNEEINILIGQTDELNRSIENLEIDRYDSDEFILTLEERVKALQDSSSFVKFLGEVSLKYCPSCLAPLEVDEKNSESCGLCKTIIGEGGVFENRIRMEQELTFQLKESVLLQKTREKQIESLRKHRDDTVYLLKEKQREYGNSLRLANDNDAKLKSDIEKLGYLNKELDDFDEQISKTEKLKWVSGKINSIEITIQNTKEKIEALTIQKEEYRVAISDYVETSTLNLIRKDLDVEEGFKDPKRVLIDFPKNRVFVDNKTRFSASSEVVLKNSVILSLFLASVTHERVRLPRFLMLDNIEDKGMTDDRVHNFQSLVVEISNNIPIKHQIIFSTSRLKPDLENTSYCIGENYSKTNKVFKLV